MNKETDEILPELACLEMGLRFRPHACIPGDLEDPEEAHTPEY